MYLLPPSHINAILSLFTKPNQVTHGVVWSCLRKYNLKLSEKLNCA